MKKIAIILVLVLIMNIGFLPYQTAKASTLAIAAGTMGMMSGIGQILLAGVAIGFLAWRGYNLINELWALRQEVAYGYMKPAEQSYLDDLAATETGGCVPYVDIDDLMEYGGLQTYANILASDVSLRTDVSDQVGYDQGTETYQYVYEFGYFEVPDSIVNNNTVAAEGLKSLRGMLDAPIELLITYDTWVGLYDTYSLIFQNKIRRETGLGTNEVAAMFTKTVVTALNRVTGVNDEFSIVRALAYVGGEMMVRYWEPDDYFREGYYNSLYPKRGRVSLDYTEPPENICDIDCRPDIDAILGNSISADRMLDLAGFFGDGVYNYSPRVLDGEAVSVPDVINIPMDWDLPDDYEAGNKKMVPFVPPSILTHNPDIADAWDDGIPFERTVEYDTGGPSEPPGGGLPEDEEMGDFLGLLEAFKNRLGIDALKNSLERINSMDTTRGAAPVIKLNIHDVLEAGTSRIGSGDVENPFNDAEIEVIDFGILEQYQYGGYDIVTYIRTLIGIGISYMTLLYVWRKIIPGKVVG